MKIIKRGEVPDDKIYMATCNNCLTEVEFKRHESEFESDQRDGDYLKIKCPVCNKWIYKTLKP